MSDGAGKPRGLLVPQLTTDKVRAWFAAIPEKYKGDRGTRNCNIFSYIIREFLGQAWVDRHLVAHAKQPDLPTPFGFFELDFASDEIRETKTFRMFDLSEILMNLQLVEGFGTCVERLKTGDDKQIEATFAELQVGKLLYIHDLIFRFATNQSGAATNYDYEIDFPGGWTACAEAKCKLESTDINPLSIKRSLDEARKQLPYDRPGIIFVKVPQHWFISGNQMAGELRTITQEFLRNTKRVVSVKFYVSHLSLAKQQVAHRHATDEIDNPDTRFARKHWNIFKGHHVPPEWDGMPPKWIRLLDFGETDE